MLDVHSNPPPQAEKLFTHPEHLISHDTPETILEITGDIQFLWLVSKSKRGLIFKYSDSAV